MKFSFYDEIWAQRDLRVEDWALMSSPLPTVLICLIYVLTVKVWGPKLMKDRPAFELRRLLIFYNFVQVLFSAWIFFLCIQNGWFRHYSFRCQPVDYSNDPMALRMADGCWWYYFSKFTEFFDTFFFLLRKKEEHISLLHVVHHGIMPITGWLGARFAPGGHTTFTGLLNSFVHICMYSYYMIAAIGPSYSRAISPWKKYLTTIQMIQFVGIFAHGAQLFFIECDYPIFFAWLLVGHGVLFFVLFSEFYWKSYVVKSTHVKKSSSVVVEKKSYSLSTNKNAEGSRFGQLLESNGVVKNRHYDKTK